MTDKTQVEAPILYGRRASTRGGTFTMVFSPSKAGLGSAQIVACKHDITSANDLIAEAIELWTSETKGENQQNRISSDWGCVALLVKDLVNFPNPVMEGWQQRVANENYQGITDYNQQPIVTNSGILNIPWTTPANKFDLLLATANKLKPTTRPSPAQIAQAYWDDNLKHAEYFLRNRQSGITTADDADIKTALVNHMLAL